MHWTTVQRKAFTFFLNCYSVTPQPTLGHSQGDSLTNLMSITAFFFTGSLLSPAEKSLKSIFFAYTHSYLNYANIGWANTYRTKLKTNHFPQKHAVRIVFNDDTLNYFRLLLQSFSALNIYQINLYQNLE